MSTVEKRVEGLLEDPCCICFEKIDTLATEDKDKATALPCEHIFHSECIQEWLRQRSTCPLCRTLARDSSSEINDSSISQETEDDQLLGRIRQTILERRIRVVSLTDNSVLGDGARKVHNAVSKVFVWSKF